MAMREACIWGLVRVRGVETERGVRVCLIKTGVFRDAFRVLRDALGDKLTHPFLPSLRGAIKDLQNVAPSHPFFHPSLHSCYLMATERVCHINAEDPEAPCEDACVKCWVFSVD